MITVDGRRGPFTYRLGLDLHITGPDNHPLKIIQVLAGGEATVYCYIRDGQQTVGRIVRAPPSKEIRKMGGLKHTPAHPQPDGSGCIEIAVG